MRASAADRGIDVYAILNIRNGSVDNRGYPRSLAAASGIALVAINSLRYPADVASRCQPR